MIDEYYTVVVNSRISSDMQKQAYDHEIEHIDNDDFGLQDVSVDSIEEMRHSHI